MTQTTSEQIRDTAGVIAPPPLIYLGPLALGLLLHRLRPVGALPRAVARPLGLLSLAGGIALAGWSVATFRRAGTPVDPTQPVARVVTAGPYRFMRNPMYTSLALVYLGVASRVNTLWPLLWLPGVLLTIRRGVIAREERYLEARFGDEYRRYKERVRRWL